MNIRHLESVLRETFYTQPFEHGVLGTNGHVAFVLPEGLAVAPQKTEVPALIGTWQESAGGNPVSVGDLWASGTHYYRAIGNQFIAEHYFRCFDGPHVTWTSKGPLKPLAASVDGNLVAIVMPVKFATGEGRNLGKSKFSDEQIFRPIASASNGWYLSSTGELDEKIKTLEAERRQIKRVRDEADESIEECDIEIAALRKRCECLTSVAERDATPIKAE